MAMDSYGNHGTEKVILARGDKICHLDYFIFSPSADRECVAISPHALSHKPSRPGRSQGEGCGEPGPAENMGQAQALPHMALGTAHVAE